MWEVKRKERRAAGKAGKAIRLNSMTLGRKIHVAHLGMGEFGWTESSTYGARLPAAQPDWSYHSPVSD